MSIQVKYVKTHPLAKEPTYATDGSGCFDLYACRPYAPGSYMNSQWGEDWTVAFGRDSTFTFDTGLMFEVPAGHVMLIFSRSGHGFKNDVTLANSTGILDADFRDSAKVILRKDFDVFKPDDEFRVSYGDRIAQAMIIPYPRVVFQEVSGADLSKTSRGAGGFGSTGA